MDHVYKPGDKVEYEDHNWEWQPAVVVAVLRKRIVIDVFVDPDAVWHKRGNRLYRAWTAFGRVERMTTDRWKLSPIRTEDVPGLDGDRTVDGSAFNPGDPVVYSSHRRELHPWRDQFAARVVSATRGEVVIDILVNPDEPSSDIRRSTVKPHRLEPRRSKFYPGFDVARTTAPEPVPAPPVSAAH